jgi:phosphoglycerol transferase MdoB-like AlkP superfamily enzyme
MTNVGHHNYQVPSSWPKLSYIESGDENNYLNCIAYIDDFLSRLFREFEQRQLLKSTVFVIVGDHGDSFGEHGVRQRAMTLFEEELHVPALIYAPALFPSGGRISGARQQIDILPTLAHVLGFNLIGGQMPGISLLTQPSEERRVFFSTIFDDLSLGMRRGSRKYIYNFGRSLVHVYDLASDKGERRDLASMSSQKDIEAATREMLEWSERSKMTMLSAPRPMDHLAADQSKPPAYDKPAEKPASWAVHSDQ